MAADASQRRSVPRLLALTTRAPLLWPAIASCAGIYFCDRTWDEAAPPAALIFIFPALFLIAAAFLQRKGYCLICAIVVLLVVGHHAQRVHNQLEWVAAHETAPNSEVQITGIVVSEPRFSNSGSRFTLKVESATGLASGVNVDVRTPLHEIKYGNRLSFYSLLQSPSTPRNPGEFDQQIYLWRKGISLKTGRIISVDDPVPGPWHRRLIGQSIDLREAISDALVAGISPERPSHTLIPAVFLGEKPGRTDPLLTSFRDAGILHLFAVSGLHVGLVVIMLGWVLRRAGMALYHLPIVLIPLALLYATVTGFPPAAVRAAIMASVHLIGHLMIRQTSFANTLSASALIILAFDSHQLFTVGFQLSFLVLIAIIVLATALQKRAKPHTQPDPFIPRSLWSRPQIVCSAVVRSITNLSIVSLVAWLASIPLAGLFFRLFTPVSVLASVLLTPAITVVLGLALLSLSVGSLLPSSRPFINATNAAVGDLTAHTAQSIARMPLGHWDLRRMAANDDTLIIYDTGSGKDALALSRGDGLIIDAGDARFFRAVLFDALRDLSLHRPHLIASHPSSEAIGGFIPLLENDTASSLTIPVERARSPSYRNMLALATRRGISPTTAPPLVWHGLTPDTRWRVLNAPSEFDGDPINDDISLIIQLEIDGIRVLAMTDAGAQAERNLLRALPASVLRSDLIIYGRNATRAGGTTAFIEAVSPQAIVLAHADFPAELNSHDDALRLAALGPKVFHQGRHGAVIVDFGTYGSATISGHLTGESMTISARENAAD